MKLTLRNNTSINKYIESENNIKKILKVKVIKFGLIIIHIFIFLIITFISKKKFSYYQKYKFTKNNVIYLDKYEENIYNKIKSKLSNSKCSRMWGNQREFINGVIRKFRPKKILEIGVAEGGSSIIILNAIQDIKNSHLYSIDLSTNEMIGFCVINEFPQLSKRWSLYKGNVAAKFLEEIGSEIDMALIDSSHYEPGEILDFLIILPFLKEGAVLVFHDIGNQITKSKHSRLEWAPYIIFNIIRGKKYLPSGSNILTHDIGAIKLEKNQYRYINDYFRSLGGQWQYFPDESHINIIQNFFRKYYNNDCLIMFKETVDFNREFVKNNPIKEHPRYVYNNISKQHFYDRKKVST